MTALSWRSSAAATVLFAGVSMLKASKSADRLDPPRKSFVTPPTVSVINRLLKIYLKIICYTYQYLKTCAYSSYDMQFKRKLCEYKTIQIFEMAQELTRLSIYINLLGTMGVTYYGENRNLNRILTLLWRKRIKNTSNEIYARIP